MLNSDQEQINPKSPLIQDQFNIDQPIKKPHSIDDIKNYLFAPFFDNEPKFDIEDHENTEVLAMDFKTVGIYFIMVVYTSNDEVKRYIVINNEYKLLSSTKLDGMFEYDKNPLYNFGLPKIQCCLSDDAEQLILGASNTAYFPSLSNIEENSAKDFELVHVKYLSKTKKFVMINKIKQEEKSEISIGNPIDSFTLPKSQTLSK